jgi:hypothetical protein
MHIYRHTHLRFAPPGRPDPGLAPRLQPVPGLEPGPTGVCPMNHQRRPIESVVEECALHAAGEAAPGWSRSSLVQLSVLEVFATMLRAQDAGQPIPASTQATARGMWFHRTVIPMRLRSLCAPRSTAAHKSTVGQQCWVHMKAAVARSSNDIEEACMEKARPVLAFGFLQGVDSEAQFDCLFAWSERDYGELLQALSDTPTPTDDGARSDAYGETIKGLEERHAQLQGIAMSVLELDREWINHSVNVTFHAGDEPTATTTET